MARSQAPFPRPLFRAGPFSEAPFPLGPSSARPLFRWPLFRFRPLFPPFPSSFSLLLSLLLFPFPYFHSRVPRYEAIAKPHGYTVSSEEVALIRDEQDFLDLLETAVVRAEPPEA